MKAVLGSLPIYYFSLFKAPNSVLADIEKLRRRFLWGGNEEKNKINWVAWNVVLGSKEKGGLGVGSLISLNWALLVKWLWRYMVEPSSLWRRVVSGLHNSSKKPMVALSKKTLSGVWYNIVKLQSDLEVMDISLFSMFEIVIGTGSNTLFWFDDWSSQGPLAQKFPNLFDLEKKKYCFVADRFSDSFIPTWAWKKKPRTPVETAELNCLDSFASSISLSMQPDSWKSKLSSDGKFYVRDLRNLIDSKVTCPSDNPTVWIHLAPLKVVCFVWRACLDRIPSATALAKRRVSLPNVSCHWCDSGLDDTSHIFVACPFSLDVLCRIFQWCNIRFQFFQSVSDLIRFAAQWGRCPKMRKIFLSIIYGFLWCSWKARNDKIFNRVRTNPARLAECIISTVFSWIKYRGYFGDCNWADWVGLPFSIM